MWRGKWLLCLLFPALLLMSAALAWSAPPVIQNVSVNRGRDVHGVDDVDWHETVWVWVYDEDGADDIRSVTITDSEGNAHVIQPGMNSDDQSGIGVQYAWVEDNATTVRVYWGEWGTPSPPPPGPYGVIAEDSAGGTDSLITAPVPEVSPLSPVLLYPIPENSVIYETVPTFSWTGGLPGACYTMGMWGVNGPPDLWSYLAGASTSVLYNADGTAAQSALTPGHSYIWGVGGNSCDDRGVTDPRVYIETSQNTWGRFTVYSPIPSISNVVIHRGRDVSAKGVVSYHEHVGVWVTDHDGAADIASVIITDTEGEAHPLGPGSAPNGEWVEEDTLTVRAGWWDWHTASPPPPGPYSITVVDQVGNSDYLTTASAPQVLEVSPVLLNPPPNNSLIYETVPTFSWAESVPGDPHYITVDDETTGEHIWDHIGVVGSTSAVYNFDGGATQPELTPGHIYSWCVYSCHSDDDGVSDPRVGIETAPHSWGRFTVIPSTPVVPGSNVTTSVDGCDLTFAEVTVGGTVYGQSGTELPSGDPDGYPVAGYGWDISTTAVTEGTITVTVHYDDMFIPDGQEASLQLVRWDGSHWVDITVARDPVNNTLTGECASLGRFAIYLPYPTLPELPGKLAYGAVKPDWAAQAVMLYSPDPAARVTLLEGTSFADWSPDGSSMLYQGAGPWPNASIWISHLDGLPPQQISGVTGNGPRWSSDGSRVCYVHQTTPTGVFEVRTVRTDGSDETVVASSPNWSGPADWSPDGAWLTYGLSPDAQAQGLWKVRYDGTDARPILASGVTSHPDWRVNGLTAAAWSPDGGRLAVWFTAQKPDGSWAAGVGVISSDGGALTPVFLVPPSWPCCLHCCGNPWRPRWSPDGTKVVVSSSHHLAVEVPVGQLEPGTEVWMMDADGSGQPVRLTYNDTYDESISWWAPNTPPSEPGEPASVTKGDTTVTFENVAVGGNTSVTVSNEPPAPEPQGFTFLGDFWEVTTTAQLAEDSKITLAIHYDDADVLPGQEEWLALLHWEDGYWVDITVRPIDTVNNIITGECTSLSPFGIAVAPYQFNGLRPPVNNDGTSIFKLKSTVPIKFQLVAPDGSYVSNATARLRIAKVLDEVSGTYQEAVSTNNPDGGNLFRYDASANQYIFNLGTKGLSTGTWALEVVVNDLVAKEVRISLK